MPEFDPTEALLKSSPPRLLKLLALDETTPDKWKPDDMAAMVRQQLAAPLAFDLQALPLGKREAAARATTLTEASGARVKSFDDLLFHADPPLELLQLAKEFFKHQAQKCKKQSPEWQVAYLFYLLTVALGKVRQPEFSSLTYAELSKGLKWGAKQSWVDGKVKKLAAHAHERLESCSS